MSKKEIIKKAKKGTLQKTAKKAKVNPNFVVIDPNTVIDSNIHDYSAEALYEYGSYTVEDRAVPDFRDGLKPVQRRVLYAMNGLKVHHNTKHKKSARIVGDAIGLYHPHGDAACYGSLVNLANSPVPLADGQGNWGTPVDPAAAPRYTEVRLTKFADQFLLNSGYLKVIPHEPNYDNTTTLPVYLPSLLPTMLLIGNVGGIAYGVRACNPAFHLEGVIALTQKALSGKTISELDCFEYLQINAPFGSRLLSTDDEMREFFRTGRTTLKYAPVITVNEKKKIVEVKSYAPGFNSLEAVEKAADKICALPKVARWNSNCGKKNKDAGPHGAYYYITPKRGLSDDELYDLADEVEKILTGSEYYNLGVTIRSADTKNKFAYCSFAKFFSQWSKYRIALELDYIQYLIKQTKAELRKQQLIMFAVKNRKTLLEILKKALEAKDPAAYVAKQMKLSIEDANFILDLQLRRLAKLEESDLMDKIKTLKTGIEELEKDFKNPRPRIIKDLKKSLASFTK